MEHAPLKNSILPLLSDFIELSISGQRLQRNGKRLTNGSIENYKYLYKLLANFESTVTFELRIRPFNFLSDEEKELEKIYWKQFYAKFTNFLFEDLNLFDNYVGRNIKLFKTFMSYLDAEMGFRHGNFHKSFYAPSEDVEIVILAPERLKYLIANYELERELTQELQQVKDIFVFGCTVGLRYSDLMLINATNLEFVNDRVYLKTRSVKTQTFTSVKLPPYAIQILQKYKYQNRLLPYFNKVNLNKKLKQLMEVAGFVEPAVRGRKKRGQVVTSAQNTNSNKQLRFCDLVTTHTMRRSAVTNMLSLGMPEQIVRQISGHSSNSKEFYRYVSFSRNYMDTQIDELHKKFETLSPAHNHKNAIHISAFI